MKNSVCNVKSFVKPNSDLNQARQILLKQNREIWKFNATGLFQDWRKAKKF